MCCQVILKNPDFNEKSIVAMSSVFGKRGKHAFLYLPAKKCAIYTNVKRSHTVKLSQEDFTARIEKFKSQKIKCICVTEVRVPTRLADPLEHDKSKNLTKLIEILRDKYFEIKNC